MKGDGNQQDYGERIYDVRLGKFLSVDPLTPEYPMLTPYQFASNRPIDGVDQDGLEWKPVTGANGNITDYTWSGFNADGSAPTGTVSGGSVIGSNISYEYSSSSYLKAGYFSINDGSNISERANIYGNRATYNFDELDDNGRLKSVFESGNLGSGAIDASGGQFATVLNKKYQSYELATTPQLASGAIESDGLGLFDWIGPGEVKAVFGSVVGAVIRKEVASAIISKFTRRAEFRAIKREMKISMSEVPRVIKAGTKEGDQLLPRALKKGESRRVYDFKDGKRIREDLPKKYPQGGKGNQKQHFNYGKQNQKLSGHSKEFDHK